MSAIVTPYFNQANNTFQLRLGVRAISIHKDFRKRFYRTNLILECHAGAKAGHLEFLLFRTWLVVFSKARDYRGLRTNASINVPAR